MDTLNLVQMLGDKLMIELPPVGLAFVSEQPEDMAATHREPQSFCTLWRWAVLCRWRTALGVRSRRSGVWFPDSGRPRG